MKALKTPIEKTSVNAGLEGVAVDCNRNIIYLGARKRTTRRASIQSPKSGAFLSLIQRAKTIVLTRTTLTSFFGMIISTSLERNQRAILKISAKTEKLVDAKTFDELSRRTLRPKISIKRENLWSGGGPLYGHGVYLLGLDNNGSPFSEKAKKILRLKGKIRESSLLLDLKGLKISRKLARRKAHAFYRHLKHGSYDLTALIVGALQSLLLSGFSQAVWGKVF